MSAASIATALTSRTGEAPGRLERTSAASPQARTKVVRMSAGPTRIVARSTAIAGSSPGLLSLNHAIKEMDCRAQAEAEGDRQRDDAGESQAKTEQPQHRARGDNWKNPRKQAGEPDAPETESETDKSGDEDEFDRQRAIEHVDHVGAVAGRDAERPVTEIE